MRLSFRESTRSVRLEAVLCVRCVCTTAGGNECGAYGEYRADTPDDAADFARYDGWHFRKGFARCKKCGEEGVSFATD